MGDTPLNITIQEQKDLRTRSSDSALLRSQRNTKVGQKCITGPFQKPEQVKMGHFVCISAIKRKMLL